MILSGNQPTIRQLWLGIMHYHFDKIQLFRECPSFRISLYSICVYWLLIRMPMWYTRPEASLQGTAISRPWYHSALLFRAHSTELLCSWRTNPKNSSTTTSQKGPGNFASPRQLSTKASSYILLSTMCVRFTSSPTPPVSTAASITIISTASFLSPLTHSHSRRLYRKIRQHPFAGGSHIQCQLCVRIGGVAKERKVVLEEVLKSPHLVQCQLSEHGVAQILCGLALARVLPLRWDDTRQRCLFDEVLLVLLWQIGIVQIFNNFSFNKDSGKKYPLHLHPMSRTWLPRWISPDTEYRSWL